MVDPERRWGGDGPRSCLLEALPRGAYARAACTCGRRAAPFRSPQGPGSSLPSGPTLALRARSTLPYGMNSRSPSPPARRVAEATTALPCLPWLALDHVGDPSALNLSIFYPLVIAVGIVGLQIYGHFALTRRQSSAPRTLPEGP